MPITNTDAVLHYNVGEFAAIRDAMRQTVKTKLDHPIIGADQRRDAIEFSTQNARSASVGSMIEWSVTQLADWLPPAGPGVVVCNPPYGERIGEEKELRGYYKQMGQVFRERCSGWDVWVFTGNPNLARELGMKPAEELPFYNGKIPCRLLHFHIR